MYIVLHWHDKMIPEQYAPDPNPILQVAFDPTWNNRMNTTSNPTA
jgi:hypothetical protein